MRQMFLAPELLETRALLTTAPVLTILDAANQPLNDGGTVIVRANSPLWLPLDATDAEGGQLTYQVTSSNTNVITTQLHNPNDSWARINVRGFGTMVVHLFNSMAPRAADRFTSLADVGAYNTTASVNSIFHRVVEGFVIQAGITTSSAGNQSNFDDAFHLDLQHNRTGILSFAKQGDHTDPVLGFVEGDYTNSTQWFITAGPTRALDFNHSVFGILVEGESLRAAINSVGVDAQDKPNSDVIIDSIELFDNIEDAVVMLKAPSGVASGTSQITVRVTDPEGNFTTRTFNVLVEPDDANGSPFILDVPVQSGTAGVPKSVQLQIADKEGETAPSNLAFDAKIVGNVPGATVTISNSGLVTLTPPPNFTGTIQVDANVRQVNPPPTTVDPSGDAQRITFNFAPAEPATIRLTAASDTGFRNDDNITNASSLTFIVSNVQSDAQVRLFADGKQIGSATASGTTATITVNSSNLAVGVNTITARQVIGNAESPLNASLQVTFDNSVADFTTPPPTTAEGNVPFTYDVNNPEEGQAGFAYSLINAPTGMTIDAATGVLQWTPPNNTGTFPFTVRATDAAGNTKDMAVSLAVNVVRLAQLEFVISDLNGQTVTSVQKGQEFFLIARVRDLRPGASGVQSAYFDVVFNSEAATVTGPIVHSGVYSQETSGTIGSGLIDEVGGSTTATNLAGQSTELFRVKMRADKTGALEFSADAAETKTSFVRAADSQPATELDATNTLFKPATLTVLPDFRLVTLEFNVDEDTTDRPLNVLLNAEAPEGTTLTIQSVGTPDQGGTVRIDNNRLLYTPKKDFFGEERITFITRNQQGDTLESTVLIHVSNVNDPPTAVDDEFTVSENSDITILDVLANDTFLPDPFEVLRIQSVSAGSAGGEIEIDATNNVIRYKPKANFSGVETFTYTIEDPGGLTSTATVRVTISDVNNPPTVVDDVFTVPQNSVDFFLDVLANDSIAPDINETLAVTAKTDPANGTLKLENGRLLYTPNPGFLGTDTFTYTVTDSRGGVANGAVTVHVRGENAKPQANNDNVAVGRNGSIDIDVLKNDVAPADTDGKLTVSAVTQPANGTATILADGKVRYVPKPDFVGVDSFTYTVRDSLGATDTATVNVTVTPVAPSEISGVVFIDANGNGVRDGNEVGIAGVVITLTGTTSNGTAVNRTTTTNINGGYQFTGLEPGTYEVTQTQPSFLRDGRALPGSGIGSAKASNVLSVNIAQGGTLARNFNFSELGRKPGTIKLFELFGSTPRHSLMASLTAGQANGHWSTLGGKAWNGYQNVNVSLSADRANVVINATEASGRRVRATVPANDSVRVRFLGKEGNAELIRLFGSPSDFNFQPVSNAAPTFTKGDDRTVLEDAARVVVPNWATNINPGSGDVGQTVSFTLTADKPELFSEQPALSSDGTLSFQVKENANGVATVTIVARDDGGTAGGGQDTSSSQTFQITITPVNDPPSFTAGPNQTVAKNAATQTVENWATNISAGPADESSQTLEFLVTTNNPTLFDVAPAISATGTLTYKPKANAHGSANVTVRLKDSGGTTNGGQDTSPEQTFTITVTDTTDGQNQPPVAVNDTVSTSKDQAITINVLQNDSDPDGDTLTVAMKESPSSGTAAVNADKTITYTPNGGFHGVDTFQYEVSDGRGGTATATVTVNVNEVAPTDVVANDDNAATDEDVPIVIPVLANDVNAAGGTITISTQPTSGQVTVGADGVVTYSPNANFNGGDSFVYTVATASGSDTATVNVLVAAVNDAPTIEPVSEQSVVNDASLVFSEENDNAILVDDVDLGDDDLEVTLSVGENQGTISLGDASQVAILVGGNGQNQTVIVFRGTLAQIGAALNNLTYNPAADFSGEAVLTVEVNDLGATGSGGPQAATLEIKIDVANSGAESQSLSLDDSSDEIFAAAVDDFVS
jgi:large repetitive protein